MPKAAAETIEVAGVTLTHPDRVLWPKQGITKRGLAEFYAGIADRILPHVVNRPLTLMRCPSGSDGACFVQKHPWAGLHQAVRRVRNGGEDWLTIDDVTGLVALVQMGVLELHPWGAPPPTWSGPTASSSTSTRTKGCRGRRWWRARGRSTRPWRPGPVRLRQGDRRQGPARGDAVEPHADWETAKAFARAWRSDLRRPGPSATRQPAEGGKERPHFPRLPAQQSRRHRGGRLLDPRAGGAPVSTPLGWETLDDAPAAPRYGMADLPAEDPWKGFFEVRQRLPA